VEARWPMLLRDGTHVPRDAKWLKYVAILLGYAWPGVTAPFRPRHGVCNRACLKDLVQYFVMRVKKPSPIIRKHNVEILPSILLPKRETSLQLDSQEGNPIDVYGDKVGAVPVIAEPQRQAAGPTEQGRLSASEGERGGVAPAPGSIRTSERGGRSERLDGNLVSDHHRWRVRRRSSINPSSASMSGGQFASCFRSVTRSR
jgi:hypothetical protein